jgi:1-phosphatidylinositol-4-phosphate 5-kinase
MHRSPRNPTIVPGSIPPSSYGAYAFEDGNASSGALDSDILKEAEQIRRERTKRLMQQQEKEEVEDGAGPSTAVSHKRRTSFSGKSVKDSDPMVLVGNLVGEGHVNYVLMYNMLTGIRVAVSRCQAKIRRPLVDEDYGAAHKYSFDIIGNELIPSAKYDFKFKDYAPSVFRELREDYFRIDPSDYLMSLTEKYILSELGSPGKSGSFFYFSRDYRFIIKTISHTEHKFLRHVLREYYNHVKTNPHTLLSRFYGLHRVKLPRGRKIHFVIMNNLFPPHRDIHETFDLKGSTVGRLYPEEKAAQNPRAVMKDLNWLNRHRTLELGPEKRAYLSEQLKRDSDLLKRLNVMDYSLLVGVHNMQRGNRDNVRRNTLKVFQPDVAARRPVRSKNEASAATAMRRAMRQSDLQELAPETHLPEASADMEHFIFYQDEGGYRATDESNRSLDMIYYLGIIDICTPYTFFKKVEHFWKGLSADRHKISPVPAEEYGDRFYEFLKAVTRGGDGGERFKAE